MENNKLLIGIQFTDIDSNGKQRHTQIELYVLRDITLLQLLDGVKYGMVNLAKADPANRFRYAECVKIMEQCLSETFRGKDGRTYFKNLLLSSYSAAAFSANHSGSDRYVFAEGDINKALCDLGFITSSKLVFDATGKLPTQGMLSTDHVIAAFDPKRSDKIFFPEYNISSRQIYRFDDSPVDIIAPTDPPQKPNRGLFSLLMPSMISIGLMLLMRVIMSSTGSGMGIAMILMSAVMLVSTIVTTSMRWNEQKKDYEKSLRNWRSRYEEYIDGLLEDIVKRQKRDAEKLDELYPEVMSLIVPNDRGVYSLNEHIYSRSPADEDFLTFRMGHSDDVPCVFPINGSEREVIYSDTFFSMSRDENRDEHVHLHLREELEEGANGKENLCALPALLAKRYACMKDAPLLYSLKNKSCLGIVDREADSNIDTKLTASTYFVSNMLFELCYYHAPEDLQFVVFFNEAKNDEAMELAMGRYKFMPHFRGLFSDLSQFVFNQESAHMVMSRLLTMMGERKNNPEAAASPHIVFVVFEEYGMKEHAFAEYLPKVPEGDEEQQDNLGLSFVYVVKHKEYLPAFCNDIVRMGDRVMTLTPRMNVEACKRFSFDRWHYGTEEQRFYLEYIMNMTMAMRFFSSVYYARLAQNGKVPSGVSLYEVMNSNREPLQGLISRNWGIGKACGAYDVTKSLRVPIGKTDSGPAYLDLHEKGDGPHMLVAGTTGSGKTETIISYLLGLCMMYRPDELNLLLVDMKGGGFTKRIGHLPHVVGSVTDVDGDENGTGAEYMLRRFLNAMKFEIKRRKLLFNRMHVDSIDSYIRACADIEKHIIKKKLTAKQAADARAAAKERLSHLILVVDEFTELKRFSNESNDVDFMSEITTIARVGRSLGFHIILISQNIEGAITDDIRANSNARLCLKVATRQASKDMIGTELAASAYMPGNGRAYLLAGTGAKFDYFQSAYSGEGVEESIPVEMTLASKTGAYFSFYHSDKDNLQIKKKKEIGVQTQLEAVCEGICDVYDANRRHLGKPHVIFSNPLSGNIAWNPKMDAVIDLDKNESR